MNYPQPEGTRPHPRLKPWMGHPRPVWQVLWYYNPTASFIFDMSAATQYASPTYPIIPKETAYVTSLSDRRRRLCHPHV
jgi:hypothetical protein